MGAVATITANTFPKQSENVGHAVKVLFHYGGPMLFGQVVRQDEEEPFRTIIKLDDGRYVLATECQYSFELHD